MAKIKEQPSWFQRLESFHPYETLLYLAMVGSGLIFLFLTVAFLYSGIAQLEGMNRKVPLSFLVSTMLLIWSGYTVTKMRLHYEQEETGKIIASLRSTFFLGIFFTVLQLAGWAELKAMGISFTGIPSGSFLYVLSGIHILHLGGAMVFALILWLQLREKQRNQIHTLILFINPFEKMRIRLFTTYWHFMDIIWLILFFLFVLSF